MRVKLDENIPVELKGVLGSFGHEVETATEEGLGGASDEAIWSAILQEERMLVTQDLDFSDFRRFQSDNATGILLLRLREPSRLALIQRVHQIFNTEQVTEWLGKIAVVTDRKIRVRPIGK